MKLAQNQDQRAGELYNLTEPGLKLTEKFYQTLASGDPASIERATAPASEAVAKNVEQSKRAMSEELPRGGARDLALEEADIQKSSQIGSIQSNAYLSSFPALAQLAGEGIGLSVNEVSNAISAFNGASSSNQALGTEQTAGKAQTLGFISALGGDAASAAGSFYGAKCWVAIELWGENNARTVRMRNWLKYQYTKTPWGWAFYRLYEKFGERLAERIKTDRASRKIASMVFEHLDRQAVKWEARWAKALKQVGLIP